MEKVKVTCSLCGKTFLKLKNQLRVNNLCCIEHSREWNAARMTEYNRRENPMNKLGGVLESRIKRSHMLRGTGEGKTYRKFYGRHEHRAVAEAMLGRSLRPGEIVHHIDGNKLNNDPTNLDVLASQSEHCKAHGFLKKKGGDSNEHFQ